jgi:hypothetical protein
VIILAQSFFAMYRNKQFSPNSQWSEWKCLRDANAGAGVGGSSPCPFLPGEPQHPSPRGNGGETACMKIVKPTATPKPPLLGSELSTLSTMPGLVEDFVTKALTRIEKTSFSPALSPRFKMISVCLWVVFSIHPLPVLFALVTAQLDSK